MSTLNHPRKQFFPLIIAFAVIVLFFGMWTRYNTHRGLQAPELESGTILPIPRDISSFNLVGTDGKPFTNEKLNGKWSMIFFGFTNCPQLCPTTLSTLNKMYQMLEKDRIATMPQIVFISVDPERDTPKKVGQYVTSFNHHFIGATGTKPVLKKLTAEMSVLFMKVEKPNSKDTKAYLIDHSGTILMMNPQGKLFAIFSTPHDATKLSHDVRTIEATYS